MPPLPRLVPVLTFLALSACGRPALWGAPNNSHFDCAALIGATLSLMANGTLEAEPDFQEKAFNASLAHFNAYSKRPEIDKKEASNAVAARQMNLIRAELPHDILRRAKACVAKTPR